MAMMSVIGLYNFDNSLFDNLQLPEEIEDSKDDIINEILLKYGELEVIYPDFDLMKMAIGTWSKIEAPTWDRYAKALAAEYNPLWNVDASIIESRSGSSEANSTAIDSSTAFNSGSYAGRDKTEVGSGGEWDETNEITRTGNIGVTSSQQLIMQEIEVAKNNVLRYIIDSFKRRFCLMVY